MMRTFLFAWWGDGFYVYGNGEYLGKDDQLNFPQDFLGTVSIEMVDLPVELSESPPEFHVADALARVTEVV